MMNDQSMLTQRLPEEAIAYAAKLLEEGELVAFPTETVYGLGADAMNAVAVAKIYAAKKRPTDHPLIVHLAKDAPLTPWVSHVPRMAEQLIEAFWPGPLTLILQRAPSVPAIVCGGQASIALRSPAHPLAQALLKKFKNGAGGVAAPSANQFGRVSPTTVAHVREEFPVGYEPSVHILEGGNVSVGIESTILDLSRLEQGIGPVMLRPGAITAENIARVIGVLPQAADVHAPRSSGSLAAHYAPRTLLRLLPRAQLRAYLSQERAKKIALICTPPADLFLHAFYIEFAQTTPEAYAYVLYAMLRRLDKLGFDQIVIEQPPKDAIWSAVTDRLRRAAAAFDTH